MFLGTGAADWPGESAEGLRAFASLLIDGTVLLDCGLGIPGAMTRFGIAPEAITDVCLTHTHGDHFCPDSLAWLSCRRHGATPLRVWCHQTARARVGSAGDWQVGELAVGRDVSVGGVQVTAVPANHGELSEQALHFVVCTEAAAMLYATDGAWLPTRAWSILRELHLDAVVWDATCGETEGDWRLFEHNSVAMIRLMRQAFIRSAVLDTRTPVFLTHLARTLCAPHVEMADRLAPEGLIVACDGMTAEIGGARAGSGTGDTKTMGSRAD